MRYKSKAAIQSSHSENNFGTRPEIQMANNLISMEHVYEELDNWNNVDDPEMAQNDEVNTGDTNANQTLAVTVESYDRLEPNMEYNAAYNELEPRLTFTNPAYNRRDELDLCTETNPAYLSNCN